MTNEDFNLMSHIESKLIRLQANRVVVGVPYNDKFLNMIGMVQETGADILPKRGKYLVIPTREAKGRKPHEIPGLFKAGHVLAVSDKSQPYGMRVYFILKESVHIPPRPWLQFSVDHYLDDWTKLARELVNQCIYDDGFSYTEVYNQLGKQMVKDVKRTIKEFKDPKNAPLTIANKGRDDPLVDTGRLEDSITWYLERRGNDVSEL